MTNRELKLIKNEILHYLCDDFVNNQAIFDREKGYQIFSELDLTMVMDAVIGGLKSVQKKLDSDNK
jgi:hypothetical protein